MNDAEAKSRLEAPPGQVPEGERLAVFERLVRSMHGAGSPREVLDLFSVTMGRVNGEMGYAELVLDGARAAGEYRVTRFKRHDGVECVPDRSPFLAAGCEVSRGGVFGRVVTGPERAHVIHELRVGADDPFAAGLVGYKCMVAVPIYTAGRPEWVVLLATSPDRLRHLSLDEMMLRSNLVGAIIESMTTAGRLAEAQARIQREVERIAEIQRSLLPAGPPTVEGLEVAFEVATYDRAGGDLVDFDERSDGKFALLIADVSGHGPSAAVVAAMVSTLVRVCPVARAGGGSGGGGDGGKDACGGVGESLTFANEHLCEKRIDQAFVTAVMMTWDPATRVMQYARAGHPPVMLKRGTEVTELLEVGGLPLGIMSDATYDTAEVRLQPGDLLLAYTDGIAEAFDPAGEQFGEARLAAVLKTCTTAEETVGAVRRAVDAFTNGAAVGDDRTLLAIRVV